MNARLENAAFLIFWRIPMENLNKTLLESLLVTEVLQLATALKAQRNTTSDCIDEAIKMVEKSRSGILARLT